MGFFDNLVRAMEGNSSNGNYQGDHECLRCHIPMRYHGAHVLRTGGVSRGAGLIGDLLLGGRDEEFINTALERNVAVHVFACERCGSLEFINDPRHGFQ
ncbi:hypothetical protein ACOJUR_15215 [Alicyclobacillus tolerans]|uniref:Uncharacterized protein n=2 Tax=Alicyclobacillus tolerans TaxID=90970 RepID=A0ABT9LTW7_9BACL|nr:MULTISPECIES: hypothetical protein [Alicyclobacillus]MDP9727708.1 hypothetical protein [Alicyclobacillus tengchongensis]QRF24394.1 hypothetical protein FY534_12730 [Alicyclobacillus sp. TC]SHJ88635.1 hypothetical protein SAMN05443507_10514 [Alicyclobacillus montanus]